VPLVSLDGVGSTSCEYRLERFCGVTAHFSNSPNAAADVVTVPRQRSLYCGGLKRIFDVAFVLVTSVVVAPVVAILALLIMRDGHSPFFVQERVGRDGKVFRLLKLRSMVHDADRKLAEYLAVDPAAREEWERSQKLRDDPRITALGCFLRRCSLDELPQFWNVLVGDMSVVGPRPMLPQQRDLYPGQAYYALKPGITGMWQVGDRHNTSFAARARYDAEYYNQIGLITDLVIVAQTVRVVFRGTGC